jgi:transcriptional/translational regulatory protein YebC/TACO1
MSGHSHWATIKRQKGAADAKRGQLFTKLAREIQIAVREGGGDPEVNFRLRLAIDRAKQNNMPKDSIERAILRGTGQLKGELIEEITYEGYGPEGTAIIVEVVTDNRNRTVSDVRRIFARHGGNLGSSGCVLWLFEHKGYVKVADDLVEVFTRLEDLQRVREALEYENLELDSVELSWIPKTMVELNDKATMQNMRLIEELEELDDVQQVYSNLEISDQVIAAFEAAA